MLHSCRSLVVPDSLKWGGGRTKVQILTKGGHMPLVLPPPPVSPPMPSNKAKLIIGCFLFLSDINQHWKVQTNTMKAYQKLGQYIYHHCQLSQVTPGHTLLVDVCILMQPMLELATEPLQLTATYYSKFIRVVGVVVILLLLMSGDIETNPGPHGEYTFLICISTTIRSISVLKTETH